MIDYIAYFLVSLITILSVFLSFKRLINEKPKVNLLLIIYLILGSLITTILYYIDQPLMKTFFTIIFFAFIFKVNSTKPFKELLYYAILIWIYGLIIDFMNMIIVSITNLPNYFDMIYVSSGAGIVMALVLFFVCSIPAFKKFNNKTIEKLLRINPSLIVEIILILALSYLTLICIFNISKLSIAVFSVFISILLIVFMYLLLTKNYNVNRLKEVNNILIKNNEFYVKLDSDYRVLKHNITHQLQGIKSVANDKTKELIDDLIIQYNSNFVVSKDINKIPGGINGIIYEKFYMFEKKDIKLVVENSLNTELVEVVGARTFNNLCETLGVLVDNALEAAGDSEEKAILIDFSEDKNAISISISNTFNSILDIDQLGDKTYSTKGKNHGIGLFSIFRKNNIKIKTKIINNLFQTELKIKKVLY